MIGLLPSPAWHSRSGGRSSAGPSSVFRVSNTRSAACLTVPESGPLHLSPRQPRRRGGAVRLWLCAPPPRAARDTPVQGQVLQGLRRPVKACSRVPCPATPRRPSQRKWMPRCGGATRPVATRPVASPSVGIRPIRVRRACPRRKSAAFAVRKHHERVKVRVRDPPEDEPPRQVARGRSLGRGGATSHPLSFHPLPLRGRQRRYPPRQGCPAGYVRAVPCAPCSPRVRGAVDWPGRRTGRGG